MLPRAEMTFVRHLVSCMMIEFSGWQTEVQPLETRSDGSSCMLILLNRFVCVNAEFKGLGTLAYGKFR